MGPAGFLDANIPIYAAGRPHPLKLPCATILLLAAEHPQVFITDAEVLQELLHRYLALRLWPKGRDVLRGFAALMQGRIEPVQAGDVERAAGLADAYPELGGRDLLHAAVMERLGLQRIVTADAGFDRLPHVERLDPAHLDTWRGLLLPGG